MNTLTTHRRVLQATLCEIERGVYYAACVHPDDFPGTRNLANYRVGKTQAEARHEFERDALALGYDAVSWTETSVAPPFPVLPDTSRRKPGSAFAVRRRL